MSFHYSGKIESSKSIVNRALILKALMPSLTLEYLSQAEDVLNLENCIKKFNQFQNQKSDDHTFDVGSGGTTFRFFSLFLSRHPGLWKIKMSDQLAKRPYQDLLEILNQLCVDTEITKISHETLLIIKSKGWKKNTCTVDLSKSSQFLSGVLLSAINLNGPFEIKCLNRELSSGYEIITLDLLNQISVNYVDQKHRILIQPSSALNKITSKKISINVGADWSSVISILCFCFSGSTIEITNINITSKEPDLHGLEFLKAMGLLMETDSSNAAALSARPSQLKALKEINLEKNPDLFPVFSVLASQMALNHNCEVTMKYPEQLIYKESNRLKAMMNVLEEMGFLITNDIKNQILKIKSSNECISIRSKSEFQFESHSDHRLVMSFELLKSFGYKIKYNHPECVKKSFHNFFEILNG